MAYKFVYYYNKLLRKDFKKFDWTEDCQNAFETFIKALSSVPILILLDPKNPFILVTDAS